MGKKPSWHKDQSWSQQREEDGRHGWRVWSGAWHSPQGGRGRRDQASDYDQIVLPEPSRPERHTRVEDDEDTPAATPLMRAVQKTLTQARKADVKVRKLKEEAATKTKQWDAFQQDLKARYSKQKKKKYQEDQKRLQAELDQATLQGQEAAANMQLLVLNGMGPQPTEPEQAVDMDWDALINTVSEPEPTESFLRDALAAAELADPRTGRGMLATMTAQKRQHQAPPGLGRPTGPTGAPAAAPPTSTEATAPVGLTPYHVGPDSGHPYVGSPGARPPGAPSPTTSRSPAAGSVARGPGGRARLPVKTHTRPEVQTGSQTFQERLDAKRQHLATLQQAQAAQQAAALPVARDAGGPPTTEVPAPSAPADARPSEPPETGGIANGGLIEDDSGLD